VEEIITRLYVGGDKDYERVKDNAGWSFLRAAKYGPGGHQQTLGYHTPGAPPGKNYLWVRKGNLLALNLIDIDDPQFIPDELLRKGIEFLQERMAAGDKVLSACNAGHNRGPTMAMLYMRSVGELPQPYNRAKKIFHTIYPPLSQDHGMEFHARRLWDEIAPKGTNA
jgi:hypothetical protein